MSNVWQMQEAKNKLSQLVDSAQNDGPQIVTRHGKEAVVILAIEDYRKLNRPASDLVTFLRSSPLVDIELDLVRDKTLSRDIAL